MRLRLSFAVLLAVLAAAPAAHAAPAPAGCDFSGPVVAHHAGATTADVVAAPLPQACAAPTGYPTSETNIVATPKGTLLFSPAQTENSEARSTDSGATWSLTQPAGEQYTALWNTVDPHMVVDWRTGRVFLAHATGATRTLPILVADSPLPKGVPTIVAAAYGFQVYGTSDEGKTWTTADYQSAPVGDWEKLMVGPPRANASSAEKPAPGEYPNIVYLCGNSPFEVSGPGRICYRSLDGGKTFAIAGYVTPSPNMPSDVCPPLASNAGVVASDGVTFQPVTCSNGAYLAVSEDEGASYVFRPVPGAPPTNGISGSLQIVVDHADTLYAEWIAKDRVQMALSRDQGRTWSTPVAVSAPGVGLVLQPAPAAGERGQFGVAYYGSADPKAKKLSLFVSQTDDALAAAPIFYSGALNDQAAPMYADGGVTGASPRADYIGAAFDAAGTMWAGGVKQLSAPDKDGNQATTGYVGRLVAPPGAAPETLAPPTTPAGVCRTRSKLIYRLGVVRGRRLARVVRVDVHVTGRGVLTLRSHSLKRVAVVRPARAAFTVRIVTHNAGGGGVVTTRSYRGCTRTKLVSRPFRRAR